jgi:hypothetical protein
MAAYVKRLIFITKTNKPHPTLPGREGFEKGIKKK